MKIHSMVIGIFLCLLLSPALAQESSNKSYKSQPLWIAMMDDTGTNYFEIQKAFDTYFQYHELPELDEEHWGEKSNAELENKEKLNIASGAGAEMSAEQRIQAQTRNELLYEVKRYKEWLKIMAPRVQQDGRIMSIDEWLALVEKQRLEQLEIEKKNSK